MNVLYRLNIFMEAKFQLGLPIPIKNHFYKGKRLSYYKHWYCTDCHSTFNFKDKTKFFDMHCPCCQSDAMWKSTTLAKAIIDRKSSSELHLQYLQEKIQKDILAERFNHH
jgi:hypothetical protein